ncbi:MAG: hypothetical protein Q8P30_02870 [Candidatus Uhrbacteria bacterium]|nr:hypothetical protein [Candidatus Uhrbacteria bacterium]
MEREQSEQCESSDNGYMQKIRLMPWVFCFVSATLLLHIFDIIMLEVVYDIYALSKMLGHNDIKTTAIYLSASVEHLRGQVTKHPLNFIKQKTAPRGLEAHEVWLLVGCG